MKNKILIILVMLVLLLFSSGITYSIFHTESDIIITDQEIAKFVFETKMTNHLELSLSNLNPGDKTNYNFSVSNNQSENVSHVTLNYQITIETYHFMPLELKLYKLDSNNAKVLIIECDETYTRNDKNALICNSDIQVMDYSREVIEDYELEVIFPSEYNAEAYANLADYINLGIKSWQKTEE